MLGNKVEWDKLNSRMEHAVVKSIQCSCHTIEKIYSHYKHCDSPLSDLDMDKIKDASQTLGINKQILDTHFKK